MNHLRSSTKPRGIFFLLLSLIATPLYAEDVDTGTELESEAAPTLDDVMTFLESERVTLGSSFETTELEVGSSIVVLKAEDWLRMPRRSNVDALESQSGIMIYETDEFAIRGFGRSEKHVAILIDGVTVNNLNGRNGEAW